MEKTKAKKTPYRRPKLNKIGKLEKLTQAKAGNKSDGASKPSTRTNGTSS